MYTPPKAPWWHDAPIICDPSLWELHPLVLETEGTVVPKYTPHNLAYTAYTLYQATGVAPSIEDVIYSATGEH